MKVYSLIIILPLIGCDVSSCSKNPHVDMSPGKEKSMTEYKWPNTSPPDKTNTHWEFNNNLSVNGTPYYKVEIQPGQWQWKVNQEQLTLNYKRESHRRDLYYALRSRILTENEMKEVENYGDSLNIDLNVPYSSREKKEELNSALLQQFKLRLLQDKGP